MQQGFESRHAHARGRKPDTGRYVEVDLMRPQRASGNIPANPLCHDSRLIEIGFRQQHCELLAFQPADDIGAALALPAGIGNGDQRFVADRMSVTVVDALK
jgi:hypothetical protein